MNIIFTSDREKIVDVSVNRNTPLKAFLEATDFDLWLSGMSLARAPKGIGDVVRVTFFLEQIPIGFAGWTIQELEAACARKGLKPADPWELIEGWRGLNKPDFHSIVTLWQGEHKPGGDLRYERDRLLLLPPSSEGGRLRLGIGKWVHLITNGVWFAGVPI